MSRIFFSHWRQQLRSVSVSLLFICFVLFFSCPLLQPSCSPGSRPQQTSTTPTSCTPWRTRGRPSSTIISLPSRCKSFLGLTWPGGCHHGNSPSLSLTQLEHEVRASISWPSLTCPPWAGGTVVCRLCVCEVVATFSRRPEANDLDKFCWFALYIGAATDSANLPSGYGHPNLPLLSGCLLQVDHYSTLFAALLVTDQSVFGSTNRGRWWVTAKCIRCSYIQKLMDRFLLFTAGPLLLSVKGIIDLAQMPPTILLPHPGGTGTPTLERIAYLPGAQPPFPPRAFNPTSISPGEDPTPPYPYTPCSLIFLAKISMFPRTSVRVQPCTGPRCQRSVLPVQVTDQAESYCSHTGKAFPPSWLLYGSKMFYYFNRKKKSCAPDHF